MDRGEGWEPVTRIGITDFFVIPCNKSKCIMCDLSIALYNDRELYVTFSLLAWNDWQRSLLGIRRPIWEEVSIFRYSLQYFHHEYALETFRIGCEH